MKQYHRKPRHNKNNSRHGHNRKGQRRGWSPPPHLTPYEKSVWLMNSFTGRAVKLRNNESVDNLLRRFKKKVEQAGILKEIKKREYYLSPSQKKREKRKKALKRRRKLEKRMAAFQDFEEVKPEFQGLGDNVFDLD